MTAYFPLLFLWYLVYAAHSHSLRGVDSFALLSAHFVYCLPEPVDTAKWLVFGQRIPGVELHLVFPESPALGCKRILWWELNRGDGLVGRGRFVPYHRTVLRGVV